MKPLIYLAQPYSGTDAERALRFRIACVCAAEILSAGAHVFSPIAHSHPIAELGHLQGTAFDAWRDYDERMIHCCTCVVVLCIPGWQDSVGVRAEIEYALSIGREVHYVEPSDVRELASYLVERAGLHPSCGSCKYLLLSEGDHPCATCFGFSGYEVMQ